MPNATAEQVLRRDTIRQLLLSAPAHTQQALVDALITCSSFPISLLVN